jgi:hypothetical protein
MREYCKLAMLAASGVLFFAGVSLAARVNLDAEVCQKQMEILLRPDVDCVVVIRPDAEALANVPQILRTVTTGLSCKLPVKFKKSQIYGEWIAQERASFPELRITCSIGSEGKTTEFSAALKVDCVRTANIWGCKPVLHDVAGLGILGRQLENYVTGNPELSAQLTKVLSGQ